MKILFSVGGLKTPLPIKDAIILAKKAGFDGIDFVTSTKDLFFYPKKILQTTEKYNTPVYGLHIPLPFILYTPDFLQKRFFNASQHFPDCKMLNFHLSGFVTPIKNGYLSVRKAQQESIQKKIPISFESNPDGYKIFNVYPKVTYSPDSFAHFCIQNKVHLNLDTSHIASWNYDIVDFYKKYKSHINLLHLSDWVPHEEHLSFGKGTLPLVRLFKEMKKTPYNGVVVFEIANFPKNYSRKSLLHDLVSSIDTFKANAL